MVRILPSRNRCARSRARAAITIASNLAYLKTIDQYLKASEMLDRVMIHPAIEPGYKTLLKNAVEYVHKEIVNLKEEKERLSQGTISGVLVVPECYY